jgi:hypothetical protein
MLISLGLVRRWYWVQSQAALGTLKGAILKAGELDEPPAAGKNSTISFRRLGAGR